MSTWITRIVDGGEDSARELVDRYATRLVRLATRQMPDRLKTRLDAEDVVQSVFRSFFRRLEQDQFEFQNSCDLWRLLAVMTYHKVTNAVKHHQRDRRDVRREQVPNPSEETAHFEVREREPGPEDLAILCEGLDRLLADLPEKYQQIVTCRLSGETVSEIAVLVGCSQRTVLRVLANVQQSASNYFGPSS